MKGVTVQCYFIYHPLFSWEVVFVCEQLPVIYVMCHTVLFNISHSPFLEGKHKHEITLTVNICAIFICLFMP